MNPILFYILTQVCTRFLFSAHSWQYLSCLFVPLLLTMDFSEVPVTNTQSVLLPQGFCICPFFVPLSQMSLALILSLYSNVTISVRTSLTKLFKIRVSFPISLYSFKPAYNIYHNVTLYVSLNKFFIMWLSQSNVNSLRTEILLWFMLQYIFPKFKLLTSTNFVDKKTLLIKYFNSISMKHLKMSDAY